MTPPPSRPNGLRVTKPLGRGPKPWVDPPEPGSKLPKQKHQIGAGKTQRPGTNFTCGFLFFWCNVYQFDPCLNREKVVQNRGDAGSRQCYNPCLNTCAIMCLEGEHNMFALFASLRVLVPPPQTLIMERIFHTALPLSCEGSSGQGRQGGYGRNEGHDFVSVRCARWRVVGRGWSGRSGFLRSSDELGRSGKSRPRETGQRLECGQWKGFGVFERLNRSEELSKDIQSLESHVWM